MLYQVISRAPHMIMDAAGYIDIRTARTEVLNRIGGIVRIMQSIEEIRELITTDSGIYADLSFDERLVMCSVVYPDDQICWGVAVWNSGNTSVDVMGYTTEEEQGIRTLDDLVMYAYTNQDRIVIY